MTTEGFDRHLRDLVERTVRPGQVIKTLGRARPNRVVSIVQEGVFVETDRSKNNESGPQLVPAWMIASGWNHLRRRGRMSQQELLVTLNAKRSAFVCALLSLFDDVKVESARPVILAYEDKTASRRTSESG